MWIPARLVHEVRARTEEQQQQKQTELKQQKQFN